MSATVTKVPAEAKAKKAEGDSEGDADGAADANALAMYKQGMADALKMFKKMSAEAKADEPDEDDKQKVQAKADGDSDADASVKADSDSDSDAEASADSDSDADASVKAAFNPQSAKASKRKTDQITKQSPSSKRQGPPDLVERVLHPSRFRNSNALFNELFQGAADAQGAPVAFREKAKAYKEGRYEA